MYSPGEGPVPFTYSAEAYPLYIRDLGMSLATATTWGFNWLLSMTWLPLVRAFKPQGAFGYYAAWNGVGFVLVLLFLPETKGRTLEELDRVFEVPTRSHVKYGLAQVRIQVKALPTGINTNHKLAGSMVFQTIHLRTRCPGTQVIRIRRYRIPPRYLPAREQRNRRGEQRLSRDRVVYEFLLSALFLRLSVRNSLKLVY